MVEVNILTYYYITFYEDVTLCINIEGIMYLQGMYGVTITDQDVSLMIDVGESVKVSLEDSSEMKNVNVGVKLTSSDLAGVLKGSLPPLQAYLTGRISTNGDIRKLMLFEKISERAHKPGATFSL